MKEINRPRLGLVTRHCHGHRRALHRHVLVRPVARRAIARSGRLVVADGATTGRFECQAANSGPGLMTYEARKLCVPRVREGVGCFGRRTGETRAGEKRRGPHIVSLEQRCIIARLRCGAGAADRHHRR